MGCFHPSRLSEPLNLREVEILGLIKEGLTNQEIAHRLFLSLDTVKWYNHRIFNKLGVNNRTRAIEKAREYGLIEPRATPSTRISPLFKHNLPATPSSFIGRKKEIENLQRILQDKDIRLVTILGSSGVGKTRLSLQIAHRLLSRFKDGVFFVSLATLNDPGLVASTIAQVFSLRETGTQPIQEILVDSLRDRQLLLVLDNFEHLLPAALLVSDLLAVAPGLKILATSRAPLHLYGEHLFPLPALSLPDPGNILSCEDLLQFESVQLFSERARAVHPGFTLSIENSADVVKICQRLEGLPLAIELAAVRANLLPPGVIAAQFDGQEGHFPFELLSKGPQDAPARHQTLHNAIVWSYDLLKAEEQVLFRRMGVFAGGCTLEAIETICLDAEKTGNMGILESEAAQYSKISEIPARLDSLVEKNLLIQSMIHDERRYTMLEMIRAYALEQLEHSGERELTRQRHAEYYLALAEAYNSKLNSLDGLVWLNRLERERDNLRNVLAWGLSTNLSFPLEQRLRVVSDQLGSMQLPSSEDRQWLEKALARLAENPAASIDREQRLLQADLWGQAGTTAYFQGDYYAARGFLERGLTIFQELDDKQRYSSKLIVYCWTLLALSKPRLAKARAEQALSLGRELEDTRIIAHALNHLACLAEFQGRYDQAESLLAESQECFRQSREPFWESMVFMNIGQVAQCRNDQVRARKLYQEGLAHCWQLTNLWGIGMGLERVARSAAAYGQLRQAAHLFAAAENLFQSLGIALEAHEWPGHETYLSLVREGLDPASFATAWAEGQALPLEQAVTEALEAV
jgi:predicted ATPase/DNA-binding CsgD family transcriptional regulator